jgi:hypothetical protein
LKRWLADTATPPPPFLHAGTLALSPSRLLPLERFYKLHTVYLTEDYLFIRELQHIPSLRAIRNTLPCSEEGTRAILQLMSDSCPQVDTYHLHSPMNSTRFRPLRGVRHLRIVRVSFTHAPWALEGLEHLETLWIEETLFNNRWHHMEYTFQQPFVSPPPPIVLPTVKRLVYQIHMDPDEDDRPCSAILCRVARFWETVLTVFPNLESLDLHCGEAGIDQWIELADQHFPALLAETPVRAYRVQRRGEYEPWVSGERGGGGAFRVRRG